MLNVLLAQEMVHDLRMRKPSPNVAFKLDMAKAYDRVQWPFLLGMLRHMGFPEPWVDMIRRCISQCWFSVLINGNSAGFFQSTRGLRQGDPLSPSVFVLAADYLSRALDRLICRDASMQFHSRLRGFPISHLAYADDVLIFSQAHEDSVARLIQCLEHYMAVSGQRINHGKSNFYISAHYEEEWRPRLEASSGFTHGTLPFTYLGVPIFRGFQRISFFTGLKNKLSERIHGWSHRQLSFGGQTCINTKHVNDDSVTHFKSPSTALGVSTPT